MKKLKIPICIMAILMTLTSSFPVASASTCIPHDYYVARGFSVPTGPSASHIIKKSRVDEYGRIVMDSYTCYFGMEAMTFEQTCRKCGYFFYETQPSVEVHSMQH